MKPLRTQPPCPFLYDALGGRTNFAVAGVLDVSYEYDVRNRLVEIHGNGKSTRFDYDAAGQRTNAVWPNGTYATCAYDDAGQLLSLVHGRANPPGEPLASFTYAYDLSGHRTNMVTLEGTHSYAYDARGQLTAVTYPDGSTEGFAYDPVGNRTSLVQAAAGGPAIATAYAYGPANRLLFSESAVETNVYTFDDAGRLVGQTVYPAGGGAGGLTRAYGYDFQSRMTSLTDTNGSVFSYGFDGEGNRIRQSLNDCLSTRFVYDGANAVAEMNASNEVVWAWIHGPGLDQPVERIAFINGEARTRQVVHADGLGSIAALTDENGEPVQTYVYNAFGGVREQAGTDLNRVTFTAREALGDSLGFFYYRHRVYDPHTGRFTSEDPLGFIDGANRYVYCANNPANLVDPYGESATLLTAFILLLAGAEYAVAPEDECDTSNPSYTAGQGVANMAITAAIMGGTSMAVNGVSRVAAKNPLHGTKYTPKVQKQMAPNARTGLPDNHGFPKVVDNYAGQGTMTTIKGGDGVLRTKVEVPGGYKGKSGSFEWIVEPDKTVNHRRFVPSE